MKILSPKDIYEIEKITMEKLKISSLELMEIAGKKCFEWILSNVYREDKHFYIFCGVGNNGGDGLVLSYFLSKITKNIKVFIVNFSNNWKEDFISNYHRLQSEKINTHILTDINQLPNIKEESIIIDCILGAGINRPADGIVKNTLKIINNSNCFIISIDFPSGMMHERILKKDEIAITANITLTFEVPKINFFFKENAKIIGDWYLIKIGLDKESIENKNSRATYITKSIIKKIHKKRTKYSNKFNYGHSLIIGAMYGKVGSLCLASKAAIKSGSGLVSCFSPKCAYDILQTYIPEVMVKTDNNYEFIENISVDNIRYDCIGIGVGIGTNDKTCKGFENFLNKNTTKLIIDADGINIISKHKHLINLLPKDSIITPHNKEFERLVGKWSNDLEKIKLAEEFSLNYQINLVIKGAHTCTTTSTGKTYFNSTGNQGMATAGSGDVLTGIITSLMSQNYTPENACILGVFIHGLAGDIAIKNNCSMESLCAEDIISNIGNSFKQIY